MTSERRDATCFLNPGPRYGRNILCSKTSFPRLKRNPTQFRLRMRHAVVKRHSRSQQRQERAGQQPACRGCLVRGSTEAAQCPVPSAPVTAAVLPSGVLPCCRCVHLHWTGVSQHDPISCQPQQTETPTRTASRPGLTGLAARPSLYKVIGLDYSLPRRQLPNRRCCRAMLSELAAARTRTLT